MSKPIIKSYVYHGDRCFFVSTILRESSAQDGPQEYLETIVFDWYPDPYHIYGGRCGEQLYVRTAPSQYIGQHLQVCEELFYKGCLADIE